MIIPIIGISTLAILITIVAVFKSELKSRDKLQELIEEINN